MAVHPIFFHIWLVRNTGLTTLPSLTSYEFCPSLTTYVAVIVNFSILCRGVKYIIMDGRVYREKDCLFPSRCEGVDYFLNSIKEHIPNTQLVINFHDWPQVNKHFNQLLPVFSFSKVSYQPTNYEIITINPIIHLNTYLVKKQVSNLNIGVQLCLLVGTTRQFKLHKRSFFL